MRQTLCSWGTGGGHSKEIPENTIEVVTDSFGRNVWGHQVDVRKTSYGNLMLMHNGTVGRTTDGTEGLGTFTTT